MADTDPGLDEEGGPGPGAPHPDRGPGGGAGVGRPGHHLVRQVVRHTELLRQRGTDLPALVGSTDPQVGTLGLLQHLLPDGRASRRHLAARLTVEGKEKFNFLGSRVMEESIGDITTSVQSGKLEAELEELEVLAENKNPVNLVRNTGPEHQPPLLVGVVPVDLEDSLDTGDGRVS